MAVDSLIAYRVTELEKWKTEFIVEYQSTSTKSRDAVSELSTSLKVLLAKLTVIWLAIAIFVNLIGWGISNYERFSQEEKNSYYGKVVENTPSMQETITRLAEQEKLIVELQSTIGKGGR